MNQLDNTSVNGGFPLYSDDFRWIQEIWTEGFEDLIKTLVPDTATLTILYGCSLSLHSGTWGLADVVLAITAGAFSYEGEIFHNPAQTLAVPYATLNNFDDLTYVDINDAYDSDGNKTFKNLISVDTYNIRQTKITTNPVTWTITYDGTSGITNNFITGTQGIGDLNDIVQSTPPNDSILIYDSSTQLWSYLSPDDFTTITELSGFTADVLQWKRTVLEDEIIIRGTVTRDASSTEKLATLPGGIRPSWLPVGEILYFQYSPEITYNQTDGGLYFGGTVGTTYSFELRYTLL